MNIPNTQESVVVGVGPPGRETTATTTNSDPDGVGLPMSLITALRGKSSGENGSNSSNGGGSGNNSDNSALVSIGNTSFGFNFDSEEGMMNSSPQNSDEGDSDANNASSFQNGRERVSSNVKAQPAEQEQDGCATSKESKSGTVRLSAPPIVPSSTTSADNEAAAAAVANLQSIATEYIKADARKEVDNKQPSKRKSQESVDTDSRGYNSDVEDRAGDGSTAPDSSETNASGEKGNQRGGRKKKKLDDFKREERNAREKERSFRISRQISELRNLLSSGGVIVPKGTKSSVLTEAANYIRMLQQHQYRSEIDRHQLVQQIQMIGGGALGQQAATAVRHVAAQNGVWSLGNFGGVPPKSAMMYHQPNAGPVQADAANAQVTSQGQPSEDAPGLPNKIESHDYRLVFNSCTVGMAVASMGGAFIDCNKLFCQLSNYTKQEVCSMTIFNLTARQDLQHAFDLISQMLSAPTDENGNSSMNSCMLRGSMKSRSDLGLSVSLIKGDDGVAKCFCVTLILNPTSPFDSSRPTPATVDYIQIAQNSAQAKEAESAPAYTTG